MQDLRDEWDTLQKGSVDVEELIRNIGRRLALLENLVVEDHEKQDQQETREKYERFHSNSRRK